MTSPGVMQPSFGALPPPNKRNRTTSLEDRTLRAKEVAIALVVFRALQMVVMMMRLSLNLAGFETLLECYISQTKELAPVMFSRRLEEYILRPQFFLASIYNLGFC